MYIILGEEAAKRLKENYIILELEKVKAGDKEVPAYCVVRHDLIPLDELPALERNKSLHRDFLEEFHKKNFNFCVQASEYLKGKFGGELDSFYDEMLSRLT